MKRDRRESLTSLPGQPTGPPKEKKLKIEEIRPVTISEVEGKQEPTQVTSNGITQKTSFSPKQKFIPVVPPSNKSVSQTEDTKSLSIGMSLYFSDIFHIII